MKKTFFLILLLFFAIFCHAQYPNSGTGISNDSTLYLIKGATKFNDGSLITKYTDTVSANRKHISYYSGAQIIVGNTVYVRDSTATKWLILGAGGSSDSTTIPAGAITTIPVVGTNPGTNLTSKQFIINTFYGSQPPLASLTGGGTYEFTSASTASRTLNWSATRQSATQNLSTIVVAGINQTFTNPAAGGTVSGTQNVTVTTNTTTTYNNVVTAINGQSATASTTFLYESKYYIGYVSSATPSDADLIAALGTTAGGTFATSRLTSGTLPNPASTSYIVFAYPSSFGAATIKIQGLTITYNLTTRSLVNASGYSVSYNILVSPFNTNAGVAYQVL